MSRELVKKNYIALICARGGSQGLPGKNIKALLDKPLIAWTISVAKNISRVDRVVVSTDSKEIADIAIKYGAEVPFMRPGELAQNDSPEWLVWQHALEFLQNDGGLPAGLVVLPVTSPLRSVSDVNRCLDEYEKGCSDVIVTATEANRSPYFNMLKSDSDGYVSLVMSPKKTITRRQDAPELFDMTTVAFVVDPKFVLHNKAIFDGRVRSVLIPKERAVDIDTEFDFKLAEIFARLGAAE